MLVDIDFGAMPPEFNSMRMYAGPGPASLMFAAAAWDELAADLQSTASTYQTVIAGLIAERWMGPSSLAMASAFGPYAAWMVGTAARAAETASQAKLAVAAYGDAFAMTVPPPAVTANRVRLATLIATNFLGQNTAAIAETEAEYSEMWAQDAMAMYGYAAGCAEACKLTPFTNPPEVVNPAGVAAQGLRSAGTYAGASVQSTLSQTMSKVPVTLNGLASPGAAATPSLASTTGLGGASSGLSGFSLGGTASSVLASYAVLPGWAGMFLGGDALAPLMNPDTFLPFMSAAAAAVPAAAGTAAASAASPALVSALTGGLGGFGGLGGLAGLGGLGQAAAVGGLSVPASWGWAAAAPQAVLGGIGGAPLVSPLPGAGFGNGFGAPLIFGGLPRAAAAGGGGTAAKYGPRMNVVARSPAAGYPAVPVSASNGAYPAPPGLPAPPGYTPAIVYLPTNGHASVSTNGHAPVDA